MKKEVIPKKRKQFNEKHENATETDLLKDLLYNFEDMISIQKSNNRKNESIKKNLQFIAWMLIISIVASLLTLLPLINKI